jgi:hypothetical protein
MIKLTAHCQPEILLQAEGSSLALQTYAISIDRMN